METTMSHSSVGWLVKIAHMRKGPNVLLTKCGRRKTKRPERSKQDSKLRPRSRLNRPKRVRRTDTATDEPSRLCGCRAWFERGGERRRRPGNGAAYLASVGPVTVLCCRSFACSGHLAIRARM